MAVALVATAVGAAAAAWIAFSYVTAAAVGATSPANEGWTNRSDPTIAIHLSNASRISGFAVQIDGRDVTPMARLRGGELLVSGIHLADGRHRVVFSADAAGLFGGQLRSAFAFSVDTSPPVLRLTPRFKRYVQNGDLTVSGTSEPGDRVTVTIGTRRISATAGPGGTFSLPLRLAEGSYALTVAAADPAGNLTARARRLVVDSTPPAVTLAVPKTAHRVRPLLGGTVSDGSPVRTTVRLDGEPFTLNQRPFDPLAQGIHLLRVTATDRAGNTSTRATRFLVNTTERLGANDLVLGARGRDVKELQIDLNRGGYLGAGQASGVYTRTTAAAVRRFQEERSLAATGQADVGTIQALTTHIVIDESSHTLTLYRVGDAPLSFPVAVGQPAYPTPTGEFHVIVKVVDPTWVPPPDAPWAQGALPIPPGPDNPLGTRWIGLSAPGVGIHGTNDPASIGYSVSHGCIRMQVPDVETLYTMVSVGTSVTIRA